MSRKTHHEMDISDGLPPDIRARAKDWVVHMTTGDVTDDDRHELARWQAEDPRHAAAFARAGQLWELLESPLQAGERASKVDRRTLARPIGRRALIGGAMAASVAAIGGGALVSPPLGLWPSLNELASDYRTAVGEQRKLALADATSIEMNTRTSLNVGDASDGSRLISVVEGEAAVKTGAEPIRVQAGGGAVTASNAEFVVRCDGAGVRVTCLSGHVDITFKGQTSQIGGRQQLAYDGRLGAISSIDPETQAGWRNGLLVFNSEPLARVVDEINRYRPGRIIITNADLARRQFTARFKIARLDTVLVQFSEAFGAKITPLAGGIVLVS